MSKKLKKVHAPKMFKQSKMRQRIIAEGQNIIIPYMGPKSRPGMKGLKIIFTKSIV